MTPVLELQGAAKWYGPGRPAVEAVDLRVGEAEVVGLVGASGAGKSTVARLAAGLLVPDEGAVLVDGTDRCAHGGGRRRRARRLACRRVQLVFQDPYTSLAPYLRVADLVAEPLVVHRWPREESRPLVDRSLHAVGLDPDRYRQRWPHELSGGERQRVALARAMVLSPGLVVADEPTAMLDPRARAGLLGVMAGLRSQHGMSLLLVTHDLAIAARSCDRLVVMSAGRVVEQGTPADIVRRPATPAAASLVGAARRLQEPFGRMSRRR